MEVYAIYRHRLLRPKLLLWLEADRNQAESEVARLNATLGAGTYSYGFFRLYGLREGMVRAYLGRSVDA